MQMFSQRSLTAVAGATLAACTLLLSTFAQAHDPRGGPNAVTMWWVIYNNPDQCVTDPAGPEQCGPVDIFGQAYLDSLAAGNPDPSLIAPNLAAGLGVIYATGGITERNGKLRLAASIYRSDQASLDLGGDQVIDPLGLGTAFHDVNAEIHLVVRSHGNRVPAGRITQITNFLEPFCSDPNLGFVSGDNLCQDQQVAMFASGESGLESMISLTGGGMLANARAYLFRQGDALQAVVETRVRD
ncbi:MAG: hypothetical protein Tsb002_36870 [Wenzhouxiangellaceae bacterium]